MATATTARMPWPRRTPAASTSPRDTQPTGSTPRTRPPSRSAGPRSPHRHVRAKRGWSPKSATTERSIPIAQNLAEFLNDVPRVSPQWVAAASRKGDRWCRRHLGRESRLLFQACDVDDGGRHTLHRLRGTFATSVLRSGGDLESLRDVLGHSNLSVTAGYLAATSESKRRAVQGVRFGELERSG